MNHEEDDRDGVVPPRETAGLIGQDDAEQALLDAYRSGRLPHAWLLTGPRGVGKATLAYRMARFMLTHPDPAAAAVMQAASLAVSPDHTVAARIAARAHPDLLVLRRTLNDRNTLRQDIAIDDVRRAITFFGSTAGEGGWRVAIVDAVDDLNTSSANALLKIIEEPPARALILLVNHAAGRVLPTIRSRCRRLALRPLTGEDTARVLADATGRAPDDADVTLAAQAGEGSVARALMLLDGPTLALQQRIKEHLGRLPDVDRTALHGLGDALAGSDVAPLAVFVDAVNGWLSQRIDARRDAAAMARAADAWDRINAAARDVEAYNLERKPFVFSVFGLLAEASRR